MPENNERRFLEVEDELNEALKGIGNNIKLKDYDNSNSIDEKISEITVQDLLNELKTDEFEKVYITTAAQSNLVNKDLKIESNVDKIQNLAEYQLSQMSKDEKIDEQAKDKLKSASNFYLIPHTVNQRYSVGNAEQSKMVDVYTVNDVEGYSLYTIIDANNISISSSFKK